MSRTVPVPEMLQRAAALVEAELDRVVPEVGGALGPGKAWAAGRRLPRLGRRYRDLRP